MLAAENGTDKAECIEVTLTHNISLHTLSGEGTLNFTGNRL